MGRPGYATFEWTEAATDQAVAMWADGKSATEIARVLGDGLTRNGVLGKLHRLKAERGVATASKARLRRTPEERAADRGQMSRQQARKASGGSVPRANGGLSPHAGGLAAMKFGDGFASEPKPPQVELVTGPAFAPLPGFAPVRLEDHQNHQCRWPIDVEGEHAARCCGAPRDGDHVYCASHRQRAVSAVTPGRPGRVTASELHTRKRSA